MYESLQTDNKKNCQYRQVLHLQIDGNLTVVALVTETGPSSTW